MKYRLLCALFVFCALSSCALLDDYWLGKDNTPKPSPLPKIKRQVALKKITSKQVGGYLKGNHGFLKLLPFLQAGDVYTATTDGQVEKRKQGNGQLIWSQRLKAPISSGPVAGNNIVAVASSNAKLYVLDDTKGKLLWVKRLSNQMLARPAVGHGLVLAKTIDGHLYAFDARNGKQKWVYQHPTPKVVLRADSSPLIVDNVVIVGFADGSLMAFSLDSGRIFWRLMVAEPHGFSDVERMVDVDATPVVNGAYLYTAAYQSDVRAINIRSLKTAWKRKLSVYQNMAQSGSKLVVTQASGELWAFNTINGTVLWRQKALSYRGISRPAISNGKVLVTDKKGFIHVLSLETGHIIGRAYLSKTQYSAPVVKGNWVYLLSRQGMLLIYRVSS